ncbi:MAG: sigma-70 family RNA polymerase sigma factor [Anaerolineae bacterium]
MIVIVLPDIPTEDRLLERARRGERDAITHIYESYFEPIYQFIRLRVDDAPLAEDLTGDVFVKLVDALRGRNAPRHSLRGWLFRVARNAIHDHYGKQQRISTVALEEWLPAPSGDDPEARAIRALDAAQVRHALRALADDQQEVLILRFGQRLSLEETADIMGRQVGAIKSLQFRATTNLRKRLSRLATEAGDG